MFTDKRTLADGAEIPLLGFGTWLIPDGRAAEAVRSALEIGYRHIDTAQAYGNERGVGEGFRQSGVRREDVFITSKVLAEIKDYEGAARSIDESLRVSGLDYFDLMLIHCPQPWDEFNSSPDRYIEGNRAVWRAMTEAQRAGKLRSIGVSNFSAVDIENLWPAAEVKPVVNQVSCSIGNTPRALIDFCAERGIVTEAYCPLGHGAAIGNPKIAAYAEKYGVTSAQLCVRYCVQQGIPALPKTENPEHMKNNADLAFTISEEDMKALERL